MKTFRRFRTTKEIKAACKRKGFQYNQEEFERGSDHVGFRFRHGGITVQVCYSTVNGRAFGEFWRGRNGKRQWFSTDSTVHEGAAWFQELLEFIYVS